MNLQEVNSRIQNLNPVRAFVKLVKDEPTRFENFLKSQWSTGVHGDNKTFSYRSKAYSEEKFQQNPSAQGRVDLILTGDLARGIYFNIVEGTTNMAIEFYSRDDKADGLTIKYGEVIWQLNEATISEALNYIRKEFINYLI